METYEYYFGEDEPLRARGHHQCAFLRFGVEDLVWHAMPETMERAKRRAIRDLAKKGSVVIMGEWWRANLRRSKPWGLPPV